MMHRHIMHHLLHVPDTEWKAAFLSNPFTWSGCSGSAALGKTPSLPGTHKWVLHVLQELFSRFSSSPIHCHPHYVCFSAGRLLPWLFYLKVEKALVLRFVSLFFYFLTSPAHLSFCSCPCSCRTSRNNHHHYSHGRKMQRLTTLQVHLNISGKQSCSLSATAGTMNTQHLSESLPSPKSRSKLSKSGLLYGLVAAAWQWRNCMKFRNSELRN